MAARDVITMYADQNTASQRVGFCRRSDVELFTFHSSGIHAHICEGMGVWDGSGGRGWRESELGELFNLRPGREMSRGAMCHVEPAE